MKRNRVNVLTVVNSASNITTETIDGKPHIVVRGITHVVDDIVMNRKLYPAAEIEKAYNTLERNPMPLGHPKVDGKHVSARDVRAVNEYHVGAWLQNVSHKDGKVTGDMYVNRHYAESSEKGSHSSCLVETSGGYALFQPELVPTNGTRVLVHAFGQLQFAVVMGGALITEDGESIEGDALDEVDVMGVVTFFISGAAAFTDDNPVM